MAIMPEIPYMRAAATGQPFGAGKPIGVVLHRTEGGYAHVLKSFLTGHKAAHFLIGKAESQIVQLVDTDRRAAHVGRGANDLYIGIEFESIPARPGYRGQDPNVISDE